MSDYTQHQSRDGVVLPHVLNRAPKGTKAHVICLGYLQADAGWFRRGGNTSLMSNPKGPAEPERRDLIMYSVLIEHPTEGLILWETGCGKDYPGKHPLPFLLPPCFSSFVLLTFLARSYR